MVPYDCATQPVAVLKSFHLPGFQSIALTCGRVPLFNSEGNDFLIFFSKAILDVIYIPLLLNIFTDQPCACQLSFINIINACKAKASSCPYSWPYRCRKYKGVYFDLLHWETNN